MDAVESHEIALTTFPLMPLRSVHSLAAHPLEDHVLDAIQLRDPGVILEEVTHRPLSRSPAECWSVVKRVEISRGTNDLCECRRRGSNPHSVARTGF